MAGEREVLGTPIEQDIRILGNGEVGDKAEQLIAKTPALKVVGIELHIA